MRVREATTEDAVGIARVHVDTWRSAYAGIIDQEVLTGLSYERCEANARERIEKGTDGGFTFVAETDVDGAVGFACGGDNRENVPGYDAELHAIYIISQHQGMGVGRMLVHAVAARLFEMGSRSMVVWVFADNPSRKFYERLGAVELHSKTLAIRGRDYVEVAYGWPDLSALTG